MCYIRLAHWLSLWLSLYLRLESKGVCHLHLLVLQSLHRVHRVVPQSPSHLHPHSRMPQVVMQSLLGAAQPPFIHIASHQRQALMRIARVLQLSMIWKGRLGSRCCPCSSTLSKKQRRRSCYRMSPNYENGNKCYNHQTKYEMQ